MIDSNVNRYFDMSTRKVFVERQYKIESFKEYLNHGFRDNCLYYSAFALMGLNSNDFLVRGFIDSNFFHGWVEFTYNKEEYVFDNLPKTKIISKREWYEKHNPRITYRKCQKEILDKYLNEKYAFKIRDDFWQFKYVVMESYTDKTPYNEVEKDDQNNGYVPSALMLARIEISKFSSAIKRFIAYTETSG